MQIQTRTISTISKYALEDDVVVHGFGVVLPHNLPVMDASVDKYCVVKSVNEHVCVNPRDVIPHLDCGESWYWRASHKLRKFVQTQCYIMEDDTRTIDEVFLDIVQHPKREIEAFFCSLASTADNVDALLGARHTKLLDPDFGTYERPLFILSKTAIARVIRNLRFPKHKWAVLLSTVASFPSAVGGSLPGVVTCLASAYAFFSGPGKPQPFSVQAAAAANLSRIFTVRQFVRFLLLSSIIVLAWKAGGALWKRVSSVFGVPKAEMHSLRLEGWVSLVTAVLVTWVTGVFSPRIVTEFLRASSFSGANGPIMKTLNDAALVVVKLVADFLSWLGLQAVSSSLMGWASKTSVDEFTKRGGHYNELVPRINSFLSARSIGSSGPGTKAFVEEGRILVAELDHLLREALLIDGAGVLIASMQRTRQQIVASVENSLFSVEMSVERVEPVCTIFCGGPRLGKTMLMNVVIEALRQRCAAIDEECGVDRQIPHLAREGRWLYSRNTSDEFFSGYNRQCVILYDDLFTGNNAKQSDLAAQRHERELCELQALVSSQPFAPQMPEVGAGVPCPKGTYISPMWVCATSNFLFPNVGCRSTEIIDDRIQIIVLAVARRGPVKKDASFQHLRFFVNRVRLSEIRERMTHFGLQEPYDMKKQMPYTEDEFNAWQLRDLFEEVSIPGILDKMMEWHNKRVGELVVRQTAVAKLVEGDVQMAKLSASLVTWAMGCGLESPSSVDVLLRSIGVRRTLQQFHMGQHKLRHVQPAEAQHVVSLVNGVFQDGAIETQVKCTCVGGHRMITECPRFKDLQLTFFLALSGEQSPQRSLNYRIDGGNLIVISPAHGNAQKKLCNDLLGHTRILGTVIKDPTPVDDAFIGIAAVLKVGSSVIESIAVCQEDGRCVTVGPTGKRRVITRRACFSLPDQEMHVKTIDNNMLKNKLFDFDLSHTNGSERADDVLHMLNVALEDASKLSNGQIESIAEVLSSCQKVSSKVLPSIRLQLATMLPPNLSELNREPHAEWIRQLTDKLQFSPSHGIVRVLTKIVDKHYWCLEQLSKLNPTYERFEIVALAYLFFQCQLDWQVSPVFKWMFVSDNGEVSLLPHPNYPFVVVTYEGPQPAVFRHDLRCGRIEFERFVRSMPRMSWEEIAEEAPPLVRFLNKCSGHHVGILDRLKYAANWVFDHLMAHWKPIACALLSVSGLVLAFDIHLIIKQLFGSSGEVHSKRTHRPQVNGNPFGRQFDRLYANVVHDGDPYKCALCQSLKNKKKVSNWDVNKQLAVVRLYSNDKSFLKAMYEANIVFLEALNKDSFEECISTLEQLIVDRKVPKTGGGVSRHLYVALSYSCQTVRRQAIKCLVAQQAEIVTLLGKKIDQLVPRYCPNETFETCKIESSPLHYCTFTGPCSCQTKDARYLPTGEFEVTGVERCVAQAASTIGVVMIGNQVVGRGIAVADGVIVAPSHVFEHISEGTKVDWSGLTRWSEVCSKDDVFTFPGTDISILKCHSTELPSKRLDELVMRCEPQIGSKVSIVMRGVNGGFARYDRTIVAKPTAFLNFDAKHLRLIDQPFQHGDSGALVIQGSHILGHYTGRLGEYGVITLWPKDIIRLVKHVMASDHVNSSSVLQVDTHGFLVTDEYDTHIFDSSPSTELRKSDMYAPLEKCGIESSKRPASQSFEALMKSFSKWEFVSTNYDQDYQDMANEYAESISTMILLENGPLTHFSDWDATLNGREKDGAPILKKVEMATSAGAPFCDQGVFKKDLIDDSKEWLECRENFRQILDQVEARFLSGDVAGYPATANNKDELRDHTRVDQKKTRLFCATPLHHNMLMRKYVGKWLGAYKRLSVERSMQAMGMDVFGDDWDTLHQYLITPGGIDPKASNLRCLAGDFSRFDTSHSNHRLRGAMSVVAAAFDDQDIIKMVGKSIEQFLVRFNGREVRVPAGLPSGCQLTTPLNCVLNILLWLTCWRKLTGTGLKEFRDNVRLVVYGDDVVVTMSKSNPYFSQFSPNRIVKIMADLGYTLEGDDGRELNWKRIEDVTFLKRYFRPDKRRPGKVHAPRPIEDVWTQLMWTRSQMTMEDRIAALQCFASEIGQFDCEIQREVWKKLCEATRMSTKEQKQALERSNFQGIVRRAWEKEGTLGDLVRLRHLFWKLW